MPIVTCHAYIDATRRVNAALSCGRWVRQKYQLSLDARTRCTRLRRLGPWEIDLRFVKTLGFLGFVLLATACGAIAQQPPDATEQEIERYRAMISDPMANPAFLNVDRGEALWVQARGA